MKPKNYQQENKKRRRLDRVSNNFMKAEKSVEQVLEITIDYEAVKKHLAEIKKELAKIRQEQKKLRATVNHFSDEVKETFDKISAKIDSALIGVLGSSNTQLAEVVKVFAEKKNLIYRII